MSAPDGPLLPLRHRAADRDALRAGDAAPARVVRVADAVDAVLRRLLRDDVTAPVDVRLRALSPDDLPADELLAELRRRDRIPLELAAAVHELGTAVRRLTGGGAAEPGDGALALRVADGVERHLLASPHVAASPLEDPLRPADDGAEGADAVHAVPVAGSGRRARWPWIVTGAAAVLVAGFLAVRALARPSDLARGESLLVRGDTAAAVVALETYAAAHPEQGLPRLYLARVARAQGRPNDARDQLRLGLEAEPGHPGLQTELGFLLLDARRPTQAVERFRRSVQADPSSERAWVGLVRALRAAGRDAEARRVLALPQVPPDVKALLADTAALPPD